MGNEHPTKAKLAQHSLRCKVILVGKSGTGKETTFKKLQQELPEAIPWLLGRGCDRVPKISFWFLPASLSREELGSFRFSRGPTAIAFEP